MENEPENIGKIVPSKRPRSYPSVSKHFVTGCGSIFVHVSFDENDNPVELFANMGKAGGCSMAMLEAVGKATSIGLRCGIDPREFIKQYIGIRCPNPHWDNKEQQLSCMDVMGKALRSAVEGKKLAKKE